MLLIGETGSGKTSFLNLICNYAHLEKLGCKFDKNGFEDLKRFGDDDLENKDALTRLTGTAPASDWNN